MEERLRSIRPFEQFVLLAVVELATADASAIRSYEVTQTAKAHIDDVDRDPFGGVERREVIAALGSLADAGFLTKERTKSATGKGRPAYELAVDPEAVVDGLDEATDVGPYVEKLQSS